MFLRYSSVIRLDKAGSCRPDPDLCSNSEVLRLAPGFGPSLCLVLCKIGFFSERLCSPTQDGECMLAHICAITRLLTHACSSWVTARRSCRVYLHR